MLRLTAWTLAVVFPSTDALPGLDKIDAVPLLKKLREEAPLSIRATLLVSVLVFCVTPVLTVGWPLPAFWLPRHQLDAHAAKVAAHPNYLIRQTMLMLKTIGGLVWGAAPEIRTRFAMDREHLDPAQKGDYYTGDTGGWRKS